MTTSASVRSATGARNESLVPAARPAAAPANASAPALSERLPGASERPFTRIAAAREQERDSADVVERLARLEVDHRLGAQDDRGAEERLRPKAVWPADRPGGGQAETEEAEVEKRREEVAPKVRIGIA